MAATARSFQSVVRADSPFISHCRAAWIAITKGVKMADLLLQAPLSRLVDGGAAGDELRHFASAAVHSLVVRTQPSVEERPSGPLGLAERAIRFESGGFVSPPLSERLSATQAPVHEGPNQTLQPESAHMSRLPEVLKMLEQEVRVHQARYALVHEGDPNEASLMATRDGHLNLARQLIELVRRADAGMLQRMGDPPAAWDDAVKSAGYILPSGGAFVVGAYVLDTHADLMQALDRIARLQDPAMPPLTNDPLFDDPEST